MKKLAMLAVFLALPLIAGCSVNRELAAAYVQTVDTVGDEWLDLVEKSDRFDEDQKDRRRLKRATMEALAEKLAEEYDIERPDSE